MYVVSPSFSLISVDGILIFCCEYRFVLPSPCSYRRCYCLMRVVSFSFSLCSLSCSLPSFIALVVVLFYICAGVPFFPLVPAHCSLSYFLSVFCFFFVVAAGACRYFMSCFDFVSICVSSLSFTLWLR